VRFSNVTPPKSFTGTWSGPQGTTASYTETTAEGLARFAIQNVPNPLTTGTYSFQMRVDGSVVAQGSLNLNC
jgi:hypothetical protein